MTTSAANSSKPQKPRYKKKGPIRTEAILPFGIIIGVSYLFFTFLFDAQLKKGIEWAATQGNGAEVNVGSLKTSFIRGSLAIGGIQVTDPSLPATNRVQVGSVQFKFLWDALLRGKFVVETASIGEIEVATQRKHPGFVLPPPSPDTQPSYFSKMKDQVSRAVLSEAGEILEGLDPTSKLKELKNLKSAQKIESLKAELAKKEAEWNKTLSNLPGEKDIAELQGKLGGIQLGGNPTEIPAKISQVTGVIQEAEAKVGQVKAQGEALQKDIQGFSSSVGEIDDMVKQDRLDLEKQLKIPTLDSKSIAKQLFGDEVMGKVAMAQRYMVMARKYMPAKKKDEDKSGFEMPKRFEGKTYSFGRPNSYPLFWLKQAAIDSKGQHSAMGGDVEGSIVDVTSDPVALGKPAVMTLKAEFPKQQIHGVESIITLDHTKDVAVDSFKTKISDYPMERRTISNSDTLKFAFAKARGNAWVDGSLIGDQVSLSMGNTFRQVEFDVVAKSKILESTLKGVLSGIPNVDMEAKVKGTWKDLDFTLTSNLASALEAGFQKQLQARLSEARKKIDAMINAQIEKQRAELMGRLDQLKGRANAQIEAARQRAEGVRGQAVAKLDAAKAQAQSQVSGAQKKAIEEVKKKLPSFRR